MTDNPEKELTDYFRTPEFRLRHAQQHIREIARLLNLLEKEGWELRDADYNSTSAYSLPFGHNGKWTMVGLPELLCVYYDVNTHEWKSDPS